MTTSDALLTWFDTQLESFSDNGHTATTLLQLLQDPPIGITLVKFPYKSVPLARSGPKGWTYFPTDLSGTRLARLSYTSLKPGVHVTGMVKLFSKAFTEPDTESYTVSDHVVLTVDNLNSHGHVEKRSKHHVSKRRKLCIHHH